MKKLCVAFLAVAFISTASLAQAQSKCCPSKSKAASADACSDMLSQLDLTEEQQAKVTELKGACDASKCSVSGAAKFKEGLQEILTAEQIEKCKTICAEKGLDCGAKT